MKNSDKNIFGDFRSGGNASLHQELACYLREKIESGVLKSGERLPSLRELARLCGVNFFSTKLATDELAGLGLLNKQHGRGMFVAPNRREVYRVGLYTSKCVGQPVDLSYFSVLRDLLCLRLQKRGVECVIWDDFRSPGEHGAAPEYLRTAIIQNHVQAVIGVIVSDADKEWFSRLPVRKVNIMRAPTVDYAGPAAELSRRGCRRIAVIAPAVSPEDASSFLVTGFKAAGVKIMARNVRIVPEEESSRRNWGEIGYRRTLELLTASPRPDALIVYPDHAATGAIQAILKLGIKVPEELYVLFHRNVELNYFCPLEVGYLDVSIADAADRLLAGIFGGETGN